jgi:tRNA(Ser,Leu) C12 N-acetylase TAN1
LEGEIGGDIHSILKEKFGGARADLENPDVAIVAEVMGKNTAIGIIRKDWFE